jgi:hypothetical protein
MGYDLMRLVPKPLLEELANLGMPYSIENGSKHIKIRVNGIFCGIVPHHPNNRSDKRSLLNVRAQIRRAAQKAKENQE